MKNKPILYCKRCILDSNDDPDLQLNENGTCNHCLNYDKIAAKYNIPEYEKKRRLESIMSKIREDGKGKDYDCILGISGGIDSTYLAYLTKKFGLRPLAAHFDNGWNSELAVKNIETTLNKLGFDLYTYVVNWEEFRDLQVCYIKASVLDWEIPTDHGFFAMLWNLAYQHNIKYILIGYNNVTEGILPLNMRWSKLDVANIRAIHRKFGNIKLKTFPLLPFFRYFYYMRIKGIQQVTPLNFIDYNKNDAMKILQSEMGWRDYGQKHYENIFTKFYQGYVLPEKFGIDKRKAHLSTLVNSKQITRDQALAEIAKPPYEPALLKSDREFVINKLEMTEEEFEKYLKQPNRSHLDFPSYETGMYRYHEKFFSAIKPVTLFAKKFIGVIRHLKG